MTTNWCGNSNDIQSYNRSNHPVNEKFPDLWKDADPGTAEAEDAEEKLAGLR